MTTHIALPARAQAQLTARTVHIHRGGRAVLTGVDLAAGPGTRLGVVGENGRGKSTLLHILTGRLKPDSGDVHRVGTFGIAEQELAVAAGRTVGDAIDVELSDARRALQALDSAAQRLADGESGAEDAYAAALDTVAAWDAWDADRRVDIALDALGAVSDRTCELDTLSVGQRYRVRLACLLGAGHDFLLLDEPTNHLDSAGLSFLTTRLQSHPGGVVVVSHDRALLTDVATHILDLDPTRDGIPRVYGGGYESYRTGREAELARWEAEHQQQVTEHSRLTQDLSEAQNRLTTGWRPDKGTGKHQRATRAPALVRSVHRRRDDLEKHAVTAPRPPLRFAMPPLLARPGVTLISAEGVTVAGRLEQPSTVAVESGTRLVVAGPNGSGKSTLLSTLAGHVEPTGGAIRAARKARVNLLRQESGGTGKRTARSEFAAHIETLVRAGWLQESDGVSLTALGLLPSADLNRPVRELSVGQQRRLDLAKVLAARPHVLLLDEPTNHLSIALVDELTDALEATEAAVIVATHDRQLLRDVDDWPRLTLTGVGSGSPAHREGGA